MVIKNDRILDAAAEVLAVRPNATLQSIAKAAGISRTTIFNRFPTRDALLKALAVDTLMRIGQVMACVPHEAPGELHDELASVLSDVTGGLMLLGPRTVFLGIRPGPGDEVDAHWVDAVSPLAVYIGRAQAHGVLRRDLPTRWLVASYIGLLFAAWDEVAQGELGQAQAARLIVNTWLLGSSGAHVS